MPRFGCQGELRLNRLSGKNGKNALMEIAAAYPENPPDFLLHYKYLAAVRRVARGGAHGYNNIFTGLGGQITMLRQERGMLSDIPERRTDLIGDLLRRGTEQTAILSGIARGEETETRSNSPLLPATRAVDLLNCISRVHRFELVSRVQQERFVCSAQEVIMLLFYLGENCVDATPDGGSVVLEAGREDAGSGDNANPDLILSFRDRGPGISAGILSAVGTPFITRSSEAPYRGLGLYAAQILAEKNQGRLVFSRSAAGETVVSAVFPLVDHGKRAIPQDADIKEESSRNDLGRHCFLVVEDDEAMRTLLLNRLQRRGHMVFCVDTCKEALEEYSLLFDIITTILMDVGLCDTSGYECYQHLRGINPQVRIIFMSGQDSMIPKEIEGNTVFLQKPFTMAQLEKAVYDVHI